MEWQTRHICTFIGAQAMVDTDKHGGRNPLVDAAVRLSIFGGGETPEQQEIERELDEMRGEVVAQDWRDDPRLQRPVPADPERGVEAANAAGSFEGFMRAFDPAGAHLQAVPDLPPDEADEAGEPP